MTQSTKPTTFFFDEDEKSRNKNADTINLLADCGDAMPKTTCEQRKGDRVRISTLFECIKGAKNGDNYSCGPLQWKTVFLVKMATFSATVVMITGNNQYFAL